MKASIGAALILFGYCLGSHNGLLALWNTQEQNPVQIYPYSVDSYTDTDHSLLDEGIPVDSKEELTKLLDDYTS